MTTFNVQGTDDNSNGIRKDAVAYETSNKLQLLISRLLEEFVVMWIREMILYRNSHDLEIESAEIEVHTGRKWRLSQELKVAEEPCWYSCYRTSRKWHRSTKGLVKPPKSLDLVVKHPIEENDMVRDMESYQIPCPSCL